MPGRSQVFSEQNMEFMEKIIERSGLGDETGLSDGILAMRDPDAKLGTTLKAATEETQMVIFDVAANLLKKANVRPDQARCPAASTGGRERHVVRAHKLRLEFVWLDLAPAEDDECPARPGALPSSKLYGYAVRMLRFGDQLR